MLLLYGSRNAPVACPQGNPRQFKIKSDYESIMVTSASALLTVVGTAGGSGSASALTLSWTVCAYVVATVECVDAGVVVIVIGIETDMGCVGSAAASRWAPVAGCTGCDCDGRWGS